jgi:MoxR-like ATPase
MNLNIAYNVKDVPQFPSIQFGETIPDQLKSKHNTRKGKVGLGIVRAMCLALIGQLMVERLANGYLISYRSTGDGSARIIKTIDDGSKTIWSNPNGSSAPWLLVLIEAIYQKEHQEVQNAWYQLLSKLDITQAMSELGLRQKSFEPEVKAAMLHLSDALYFAAKEAVRAEKDETLLPIDPIYDISSEIFERPQKAKKTYAVSSQEERLTRLALNGGTALLVGPTGTFKTETAKRVAITLGSQLVIVKGRPGLEDSDFFGAIVPTTAGAKFVDGPLTTAYRTAQSSKTVLIIDELMRFESYHLAGLIGALDTVTTTELTAMGISTSHNERHRVLELPNGERIAAPVSQLTIIATTNLGDDYQQAGQGIDAALMGRFNVTLDFDYAPEAVALEIYKTVSQNDYLANQVLLTEKWTRANTAESGGLLQREANPRVVIAWLEEITRCLDNNLALEEAIQEAATITLIPYCVARTSNGKLDPSAVQLLRDHLEETA